MSFGYSRNTLIVCVKSALCCRLLVGRGMYSTVTGNWVLGVSLWYSAELRDIHLSALQRDHELRSQFEARQIRKEAAEEDARRQEIAVRAEKERQIKARIEAEV